ncbi:MAG: ROK family protein [Oscillospiraceae bacterium]|nr:ROK family protein [Oscillospiraceae bacterium]
MGKNERVLGVDIGGTTVKMGILDKDAGLIDIRQIDMVVRNPELMADRIATLAKEYAPGIVGVGSAGAVNHKTGLVSAGNLEWREVPLRAMLEERLRVPVWVDNDAKAALMAEWHSGVCKGTRCAVCVTLGTGLGGGLLIDGKPWRGDDNTAFELGHIVTHGKSYAGTASKEGRLECYASGIGLSRLTGGRPAREVVEGVMAGDTAAMSVFDEMIGELAIGLCTVIILFKPEVIALGGGISAAGGYLLDGVRNKVAEYRGGRSNNYDVEQIKLAVHGNNAGMIGAAALAQMYLLDSNNSSNSSSA